MSYGNQADAYRHFVEAYGEPSCCGRVHWDGDRLERWLREQPQWDGEWENLLPALVTKAAAVAWDDYCEKEI